MVAIYLKKYHIRECLELRWWTILNRRRLLMPNDKTYEVLPLHEEE